MSTLSLRLAWVAGGVALIAAVGLAALGSPLDVPLKNGPIKASGPLVSRGYTEAPAGSVVIAGNPEGGAVVTELRVQPGQTVKQNQIIAVLSTYAEAEIEIRRLKAELAKDKLKRQSMVSGHRIARIAHQEVVVKSTADSARLKELELTRSTMPPDERALQISISQKTLDREEARLKVLTETLAADLRQIDLTIRITETRLEDAEWNREQALVRAPFDGVIADIFTKTGESISRYGIAHVIDLSKIRIITEIDETHLGDIRAGGKVDIVLRGDPTHYSGTIVRVPLAVQREKFSQAEKTMKGARLMEVEIAPDDPSALPPMLGREARVTFQR